MNEQVLQNIYTSNIKRLRKAKGLSQVDLAKLTGMSSKFISYIESGHQWGSFKSLVTLSEALGVEPFELLRPRGKHPNERDAKLRSLLSVMTDLLDEQE